MNAPSARAAHTAVWTGTEMIVWGGTDFGTNFNTGGRYNPGTDSWTATSTANAPSGRYHHTAVWTGSEMIVWGGRVALGTDTNTGGNIIPAPTLGQLPALSAHPLRLRDTRQFGPALK